MIQRIPEKVLQPALRVGLFIVLMYVGMLVFFSVFFPLGLLIDSVLGVFAASLVANALLMRIFEQGSILDVGLHPTRASAWNLALGLIGGIAAALVVVGGPLLEGAAVMVKTPEPSGGWQGILFLLAVLFLGAAGEEMMFRGYGFQVLIRALGPFATILPISVLFALMHANNPNVTKGGLINTALWGVLLGYAFWRSGDLWLPIGLHVGWNWSLPLLGVNLSGFTMSVTGYTLRWNTSTLWSGGGYGPEGALTTTVVVGLLFAWLALKAPVRRQTPALLRETWEDDSPLKEL